MWQIVIIGLFVAGAVFAGGKVWNGFTGQYFAEGVTSQIAADKAIVEAAESRAKRAEDRAKIAEDDAAGAVAALGRQNAAIDAAGKIADGAVKAAREGAIKYANEIAASQGRVVKLQAQAKAAPTSLSCEAELAAVDAILTESLNARRLAK
jgi:hypothetical protein